MFMRFLCTAMTVCVLALGASPISAADRAPSTPEERQQALDYIHHFQADPLNPDVKSQVQWVTMWAIQVPDVHVNLCILVDLPKGDKKHSQTLFTAIVMSQTAFAIQHRDNPADVSAEYLAGLDGLLSVYEKVVAANAKDRQPALDDLLQRRQAGTLADYVKERAATSCKK
jgi:hypothetical protein